MMASGSDITKGNSTNQNDEPPNKRRALDQNWIDQHRTHLSTVIKIFGSKVIFKHLDSRYFDAVEKIDLEHDYYKSLEELIAEPQRNDTLHDECSQKLRDMICLEEAYHIHSMKKYDRLLLTVEFVRRLNADYYQYKMKIEGAGRSQSSIKIDDKLLIYKGPFMMLVDICDITQDDAIVFNCRLSNHSLMGRYNICILSGGLPYIHYQNSIGNHTKIKGIDAFVIVNNNAPLIQPSFHSARTRLDTMHFAQSSAIDEILLGHCRPNPYLLFGGPGTGKTTTLVEAVYQIRARSPSMKVLVCANSDNSVDRIADMMATSRINFTRLRAGQRPKSRPNSNLFSGPYYDIYAKDMTEEVELKHVVLTTNILAANLHEHKYHYVFIDDVERANYWEARIPINQLASDGLIVLVGDRSGLPPPVRFKQTQADLGASILRKLSNFHELCPNQGRYFITELIVYFRCDSRILARGLYVLNYFRALCVGKTPASLLRMLKVNSPLVVIDTLGDATIESNKDTLNMCSNILMKLLKMGLEGYQLGVITWSYSEARYVRRKFRKKLRETLPHLKSRFESGTIDISARNSLANGQDYSRQWVPPFKWNCKIDSFDSFQGDERNIVIIPITKDTVQAKRSFYYETRQINFALSRANWVVILLADLETLCFNSNWSTFLQGTTRVPLDHPLR